MARHTYRVTWTHRTPVGSGEARGTDVHEEELESHYVEADAPEQAAAEALLGVYGAVRPAMAPERVEVDGEAYRVDEWLEAAVHLAPEASPPERAHAEAGLRHLRLARKALAPFSMLAGDEPRRGRGVHAELGELEARLEVLVADLGGRP